MGRVDEARRRAAEAATTGDVAAADAAASTLPTEPAAVADDVDVDVLAREPYPIEIGERRRARTVPMTMASVQPASRDQAKSGGGATANAKSSVHGDAGAANASPADAAPSDAVPPRTLFERLAARLSKKVVVDQAMMPASRPMWRPRNAPCASRPLVAPNITASGGALPRASAASRSNRGICGAGSESVPRSAEWSFRGGSARADRGIDRGRGRTPSVVIAPMI